MAEAPPTEKFGHHVNPTPGTPYKDVPELQGSSVGGQNVYEMSANEPTEIDGRILAGRT